MALKALKLTGWFDGELPVNASGAEYVAGQPLKLGASGLELATSPKDVLGISKNDRRDDLKNGPQAADGTSTGLGAFTGGFNKLRMTAGKLAAGTARSPFKTAPTSGGVWALGQRIFLASDGTWDNAEATPGDAPFGMVTGLPDAATLEGIFTSMAGASIEADLAGLLSADAAGRAVLASGFFDAATVASKFAAKSILSAKLDIFVSPERTATGAAETVAHTLGNVPAFVLVIPTDTAPATAGVFTVTEGAHDATSVVVTVTTNKKFKIVAMG